MTNAEARFNNSLRPRKPEGSLGRTAQEGHLDSHTAPEHTDMIYLSVYHLFKGLPDRPPSIAGPTRMSRVPFMSFSN